MRGATTWKSNSVFASFCYKDFQYVFEGIRSHGSFVGADSIIVNPT